MSKKSIREYTTRDLIVSHWMENLGTAYERMIQAHVRHLPVVDDNHGIIGIISDRDFQRAMQIDQPDFTSGLVAQAEFDPNARVRDFMSWPIEAIKDTASIADAARLMVTKKISALLVISEERVKGIVTSEDLLRSLFDEDRGRLEELKEDLQAAIYESPIGQIANTLANAGL